MNLHDEMMKNRKRIVFPCVMFIDSNGHKHGPCEHIDGTQCSAYMIPESKWKSGMFDHCPLATHWFDETIKSKKIRVGQQKQKKH